MSDFGRELAELKKEIVEARNQAIKTDNQIKNLTLDVKSFGSRFDSLDGRVRLSSLGVHLIVAGVFAVAAYFICSFRTSDYEAKIKNIRTSMQDEYDKLQTKSGDLQHKLSETEKNHQNHEQSSTLAGQILTLLDNKQEKEASDKLSKLDPNALSPLERQLTEKRFAELRRHEAESAYRAGRSAAQNNRHAVAVSELRRAMAADLDSRSTSIARYYLATSLYALKKYDEAEPLFREIIKSDDKNVIEEAQYLLAAALARLGKRDDAKSIFSRIRAVNGRFAGAAKIYLTAMEGSTELPVDLPGWRLHASPRRSHNSDDSNTTVTASE